MADREADAVFASSLCPVFAGNVCVWSLSCIASHAISMLSSFATRMRSSRFGFATNFSQSCFGAKRALWAPDWISCVFTVASIGAEVESIDDRLCPSELPFELVATVLGNDKAPVLMAVSGSGALVFCADGSSWPKLLLLCWVAENMSWPRLLLVCFIVSDRTSCPML